MDRTSARVTCQVIELLPVKLTIDRSITKMKISTNQTGGIMKTYAITPKGQVTIPVSLREELKLKPGDKVLYEKSAGGILIKPARQNMLNDFGFLKNMKAKEANLEAARKAIRSKLAKKRI